MSLEAVRENKTSMGTKIVIGLLLLGMAGFGTSQFNQDNGSGNSALSLGDFSVSRDVVTQQISRIIASNPNVTKEDATKYVVDDLAKELTVKNYISDYPFVESDIQVAAAIKNNSSFATNGEFDADYYKSQVINTNQYEKGLAQDLAYSNFQKELSNTSIISELELNPYYETLGYKRDVQFVELKKSSYKVPNVTEAEISAYFDENRENFKTEKEVNIDYIDLSLKDIVKEQNITDVDKNLAYESYVKETEKMQKRRADYVMSSNELDAKAAMDALKQGKTINEIAALLGDKLTDSGDLGVNSRGDLDSPDIEKALFALKEKGSVSTPIKVDSDYFVIKLNSISGEVKSKSDLLAELGNMAKEQKAKVLFDELSKKLEDAVFENASPTLDSISEATGIKIKKTGLIKDSDKSPLLKLNDIKSYTFLGAPPEIGKLQDVVKSDNDNRLTVYKVSNFKDSVEQVLFAVNDKVKAALIEKKEKDLLTEAADKIITELKTKSFDDVAKINSLTLNKITALTQKSENKGIDPVVKLRILSKPPKLGNDNASKVGNIFGDTIVYVTNNIELGNGGDDKEKSQIKSGASNQIGQLNLVGFINSISERSKVQIKTDGI